MPLIYLTPEDVKVLQALVRFGRSQRVNLLALHEGLPEGLAPDVYIAKTPTGGIPALTLPVGTSTGMFATPGKADCDIYTIRETTLGGTPQLVPIPNIERTVYNISLVDVEENEYILIKRIKGGKWVIDRGVDVTTGTS